MTSSIKDTLMKKSLGRYLILTILLLNVIYADGFISSFNISNNHPYLKEPIILTLDINQTDSSCVMLFKFNIKKSSNYIFKRLDIQTKDDYHSLKIRYIYEIYPLKTGEVDINFDFLQMVTTDEKIAYSFSGDRDNVKGLNKRDIPISFKPITIDVKPLPKDTQIVGEFTLKYNIKKSVVEPYQPIPMDITIKGDGYPPVDLNLIPQSDNYRVFKEVSNIEESTDYSIAVSAKSSFELEPIVIRGFNPKTEREYNLTIPKHKFIVKAPDISKLIDSVDSPKPLSFNWSWVISLLSYLIIFISGFLTAKIVTIYSSKSNNNIFLEEVKKIDNSRELLQLLMARDTLKYADEIYMLESLIYNKIGSLKEIKKSLIKKEREL